MFALAARSFSQTSETFVRLHAERIAPGRTVFLTFDRSPTPPLPGPVLAGLNGVPRWIAGGTTRRGLLPTGWVPAGRTAVAARFLRENGVTVMMAEFGPFGAKLLPAARAAGVRMFVHFHGWDASRALNERATLASYRPIWAQAAGVFAPSRFLADKLVAVGCPPGRIAVTPCGVDPGDFAASARLPGRCIMVGRLVPKKAPQLSVAAFARVADRHPDARLDVIGDGPLLGQARAEAAGSPVAARIHFHGARPHAEVRQMMRQASIFLQHSVTTADGNTEGLPVSVLEAMSSGLCVVSTRHSGIPEAVIDGDSGLLVDEGDVGGMATALDRVLADPALAVALGEAAAARVRAGFTVDHTVAALRAAMGL